MRNVITPFILALLLGAALPAALLAQGNCATRCSPPSGDQKLSDFVMIEADTGRVLSHRTQFPVNTQIQMIVVHQNPFKFSYRYVIEEREIELDIIRDAMKLFKIPTSSPDPMSQATSAPGMAPPCTALDGDFAKLTDAQAKVLSTNAAARQELANLRKILGKYNEFLKTIEKPVTTEKGCQDLCSEAAGLATQLGDLVERKALTKAFADFKTAADELGQATGALDAAVQQRIAGMSASDQAACNVRLAQEKTQASSLATLAAAGIAALDSDIAAMKKLDDQVKKMRKLIKDVLDDENAFVYVDYLEARPSPREWIVKVIRKNRSTDKETTVEVVIRAGRSRFSISAGIGYSFIEQQNFIRQQGKLEDGSVGNVFAVEKASDEQVGAVLQLNAALSSKNKWSWGWSLGVTTGAGEDGDVGYFTGPTMGFLDNQLFFTVAYHLQDVKTLSGGFEIGNPVPDGLQDPLPTRTDSKGGVLLTVTYKIR